MSDVENFRDAQAAEYGEYVAVEPININGVRAFNVGDPVPKSHVTGAVVAKSQIKSVDAKASKAPATGEDA